MMLPLNLKLFFGFDKGKEPYSCIVTSPRRKVMRIEQVYYTDGYLPEQAKTIYYVSAWRMSFLEKLKCFFLGRIFFTIRIIPGMYPPEPLVSFKGPKFHELNPFKEGVNEMLKQRESLDKK